MARLAIFGGHPSPERLLAWLNRAAGEAEPDDGVDAHLADCDRCADRLEALARQSGAPLDGDDGSSAELAPRRDRRRDGTGPSEAVAGSTGSSGSSGSTRSTDPIERQLGAVIEEIFAPPPDLAERIKQGVSARERSEREMSLMSDLFRVPFDVLDALGDRSAPTPPPARQPDDAAGNAEETE